MKLSVKTRKILDSLGYKFWSKTQKDKFGPVLSRIEQLENDLKACEQQLRELRQVSLLDPPVDKYQGRSSTLPEPEKTEYDIEHHAYLIVSQGNLDTTTGKRFMERRNLTEDQVKSMALAYEKKVKKD